MTSKRILQRIGPQQTALGLPTLMDRDLAAAHSVTYVHLAVFAIDIDRIYWLEPEDNDLPFGWEVFVTEQFLLSHLPAITPAQTEMLEAICMPLLEETPGEPPLGGQIVFAVFDAVQRALLPETLRKLFATWRTPPRDLLNALNELHSDPQASLVALARYCLQAELSPPLAPPTREALLKMASYGSPPNTSPPSAAGL